MRYLVMHRTNEAEDAAAPPDPGMYARMGAYMQQERAAGVLLAAEGVWSSAHGARVTYVNGEAVVTDGPFTEATEVIGGFAVIQVASLAEAVAAVKRFAAVFPPGRQPSIEIRRIFEESDFGPG